MVSVTHLVKRYGSRLAVDDLSFGVKKGDVVGFLGPNGAGKSTTLRILSGFLGMTSGTVTVAGHDIKHDSFEARRCIGYMPEAVPLYPEMRVAEYLTFRAELKQVARSTRAASVDLAMEKANVTEVANVRIGSLSKGYRQRVGLADALVAKPPLLILDEPTAGLDPNQIREVRDVIRELGKEHTVLLSTHILSEVRASCSRVILISKGKLLADGTLEEVQKKSRWSGVDFTVRGDAETAKKALSEIPGIRKTRTLSASGEGEAAVSKLRAVWLKKVTEEERAARTEDAVVALVNGKLAVRHVEEVGSSLEEIFTELTRGARDVDAEGEAPAAEEDQEAES